MTITRRLLRSILIWLGVLLMILTITDGVTSLRTLETQERQALERLLTGLESRLESRRTMALALATEMAYNPQVQALFAARERQQLLELVQISYVRLREAFAVSQFQFHLAPATSFLRVNQPTQYGDDLSSFRPMVIAVNATRQPVSGLEVGRSGLGLRGVVPMFHRGYPIGSVEFGLDVGAAWLAEIKGELGGEWQIILNREMADLARYESAVGQTLRPTQELVLQASTLDTPFFAEAEYYRRALAGETVLWHRRVSDRSYVVWSRPLRDYSGQVIGIVDVIFDRTELVKEPGLRFLLNLAIVAVTMVLGGAGFAWLTSRIMRPVGGITTAAAAVAEGDFDRVIPVDNSTELGELARAFNRMTEALKNAFTQSAERTQELDRRARYLEATAAVARDAASVLDVEQLLARAVRLISEKFDFYHAGLFLLDATGEWAILRAASSEGGQRMLARGHRLRVGEQGIVGYVARLGQSQIALDVGADRHFFNNPDLSQTRSEIALPLRAHDEMIGVLDVQSVVPEAFSAEDVEVLQTLADQVAMAIHNAYLFNQTQQALEAERRAYGETNRQAWVEFLRAQSARGFVKEGAVLRPLEDGWAPELARAIQTGQTTMAAAGRAPSVVVPIKVRDQTIAVLDALLPEGVAQWAPDQIALLESISGQLAQALERARLYEGTRLSAARERTLAEVSSRMREPLELEAVLQMAVSEIREALDMDEVVVRLLAPEQTRADDKGGV